MSSPFSSGRVPLGFDSLCNSMSGKGLPLSSAAFAPSYRSTESPIKCGGLTLPPNAIVILMPPSNSANDDGMNPEWTGFGRPQEWADAGKQLRAEQLRSQALQAQIDQMHRERAEAEARTVRNTRRKKASTSPVIGRPPSAPVAPALMFAGSSQAPQAALDPRYGYTQPSFIPANIAARAEKHLSQEFTEQQVDEIRRIGKMLVVFTHPWFHNFDIYDMSFPDVADALKYGHMYCNPEEDITDEERVRLLIAQDLFLAVPASMHPFITPPDKGFIKLLKEGAEAMRTNAIKNARDSRRALLLEVAQDAFPQTVPGHSAEQCFVEGHNVLMCPRFAALLSSPRLDDLVDIANGVKPPPPDIKAHAYVGPYGNGDDAPPATENNDTPLGSPDYPILLFARASALMAGIFSDESLYRFSRTVLWGPAHRFNLVGKELDNGRFEIKAAGSNGDKWGKTEAEPGVLVFGSIILLCVCFGDMAFKPVGKTSGYDYQAAASRWLLLIADMVDESNNNPGSSIQQTFANFNHHVFGHGLPTNDHEQEKTSSQELVQQHAQENAHRRRLMLAAAVRAPASPASSPRRSSAALSRTSPTPTAASSRGSPTPTAAPSHTLPVSLPVAPPVTLPDDSDLDSDLTDISTDVENGPEARIQELARELSEANIGPANDDDMPEEEVYEPPTLTQRKSSKKAANKAPSEPKTPAPKTSKAAKTAAKEPKVAKAAKGSKTAPKSKERSAPKPRAGRKKTAASKEKMPESSPPASDVEAEETAGPSTSRRRGLRQRS